MFLNKTGRFRATQELAKRDSNFQYKPFQVLFVCLASLTTVSGLCLVCTNNEQQYG